MYSKVKLALIFVSLVVFFALLAVNLAQAKSVNEVTDVEAIENIELDQAQLDQLLAPIALYPDTVLSQVLVAATYPLELVQAARWRENNSDLNEKEALDATEDMDWDPSVKALVPFDNLLQQLVEDLNWLQDLGDAFLSNETQVLASVQSLRQKAYEQGSLSNNKYIEVIEEDDDILITPVNREVIYVPYYDSRVVYGSWHWASHPPYYWHRPSHYLWHAGLYWSPRVYIRNSFFFGGFNWHNRHVVVYHTPRRYGRYDDGHRRVRVNEYQRWSHNSHHRRGVRYSNNTPKTVYSRSEHNVRGQRQVQNVKRALADNGQYSGDQATRSRSKVGHDSTQTHRRVTSERNDKSRHANSAHRDQNNQRVKNQGVQRPVKQYQSNSTQTVPKQRNYSQPKQKTYSQPQQRSVSKPQQRVRSTVQRSGSKARSHGAKQKQR